jgi:TonB family protein
MLCVFASLSAPVGAQAPAQKKTKAASQPCFPTVSYVVNEDGAVTNVKIMKSTGSAKVDTGLIKSVQSWKYKPQPGCTVETSMAVVIDIGQE